MLYDILSEEWIEDAPDIILTRQRAAQGSGAFLASLQAAAGTGFACGHLRMPENTHTVAGKEQCRTCRRKRWNDAVKKALQRAAIRRAQSEMAKARADMTGVLSDKRVEELLAGNSKRLPLDELKAIVASRFGFSARYMLGPSRVQDAVRARSIVAEVLYRRGVSYPRIGTLLGGRDHSSMINARKMFPIYCERDPRVMATFLEVADK